MEIHVGLIPDGNRRFARKKHLSLDTVYNNSIEKAWQIVDWCYEEKAKSITMYAFSTENFQRPQEELDILYRLLSDMIDRILKDNSFHYRVQIRGNRDLLASHFGEELLCKIDEIERKTARNMDFTVILLLAYGARDEWKRGIDRIYPTVNVLIRTAGELRTSNFPFSPNAYFYSCKKLFPTITKKDIRKAINRGNKGINSHLDCFGDVIAF